MLHRVLRGIPLRLIPIAWQTSKLGIIWNLLMRKITIFIALIFVYLFHTSPVSSQDRPEEPVYIVQSGDTLTSIAIKFGISLNDLSEANSLTNLNALNVGDRLVIPGLEGVTGTLALQTVPLGENLYNISKKLQIPLDMLTRLNRITSPTEIYAGVELILPEPEADAILVPSIVMREGQSLLESSVKAGLNPWLLAQTNDLSGTWDAVAGESLYTKAIEAESVDTNNSGPLITELIVDPLPLVQGKTTTIIVKTTGPIDLSGTLIDQDLHFFQQQPGEYIAFAGIPALHETGLSEISIQATSEDEEIINIQQMIFLSPGLFSNESIVGVEASTIDPAVIMREDQTLAELQVVTPERYWSGSFAWPVDEPCPSSRFGNRRSYNSGQYFYYHTGLDFTVCAQNLNIYAAAPGTVVFSGPLEIKGLFTVIDHGWGVYSGYAHQSELFVKFGDRVETGQLIGLIGNTGRSVGPHLHWEVWVNGIQVDPLDWILNTYP
jgi:murein DD-endopeptidase MepM/ murein hydrolase activator NlpD